MKNLYIAASILTFFFALSTAYADNSDVENAIKSQPDLSGFYQALVNTGVNHELNADTAYTVFAPTNEALDRIREDQYPCFYNAKCKVEVAAIVRNHIVPNVISIKDTVQHKGGFFSIGDRFVTIGEPYKDDYTMAGNNVVYTSEFSRGVLYKIDGVIANPIELSSLQYAEYPDSKPKEVIKKMTAVTKRTIPYPSCGKAGCPDAVTKTTTITRTVTTPPAANAPMLAPAAR